MRASATNRPRRTAIIDEHALGRDLLARALEADPRFALVATGRSAAALLHAGTGDDDLDAVLVSVGAPGPDLAVDVATLAHRRSGARVVVVALVVDGYLVDRLAEAGAAAVLSAQAPLADVLDHLWTDQPTRPAPRADDHHHRAAAHGITEREHEILAHLADGTSPQQIARLLGIRVHTVRDHVAALRRKLDCSSATDLVVTAHRLGLAPHVGRPLR